MEKSSASKENISGVAKTDAKMGRENAPKQNSKVEKQDAKTLTRTATANATFTDTKGERSAIVNVKGDQQKKPQQSEGSAKPATQQQKEKQASSSSNDDGTKTASTTTTARDVEGRQKDAAPAKTRAASEKSGPKSEELSSNKEAPVGAESAPKKKDPSDKTSPVANTAAIKGPKSGNTSSASAVEQKKKVHAALPTPTYTLSEIVQEDATFSNFQYMALTEADNMVYGYGTLSTDPTAPQMDDGVIEYDTLSNRFNLLYCTKLAMERQSTTGSCDDNKDGITPSSPGCRTRARVAACKHRTSASVTLESSADNQDSPKSGGGSNSWSWRMLLFGGVDQNVGFVTNDVWEFRLPSRPTSDALLPLPSVGSWRELTPTGTAPPARGDHAMCVSPEKTHMYVFGGTGQHDILLNDCYVLKENNDWTRLSAGSAGHDSKSSAALPAPRRCSTIVCSTNPSGSNVLYLFGGDLTTCGSQASNELWKFNVQQRSWTLITLAKGTPPTPRYDHASTFANNRVWISGGVAPGWLAPTELKDLYGFDVTALCWFQCSISLCKVQQPLPRFRPLAFVPAIRSFLIFGCSEHKSPKGSQAAVCALIPVCTVENLKPLEGLNSNVKRAVNELAENALNMGKGLQKSEKKLPELRQQAGELEQKRKVLLKKLRSIEQKKEKLGVRDMQLADIRLKKMFEDVERRVPELDKLNRVADELSKALQQLRAVLNTKAAAADVAVLAESLERLRNAS